MAISKMKKLSLVTTRDCIDELTKELTWINALEAVVPDEELIKGAYGDDISVIDIKEQLSYYESISEKLTDALAAVGKYRQKKKFLDFSKKEMSRSDFEALENELSASVSRADEINAIGGKLSELRSRLNSIEQKKLYLEPWKAYPMPLLYGGTKNTSVELFSLPSQFLPKDVINAFDEKNCYVELISSAAEASYYAAVFNKADDEEFRKLSSFYGCTKPALGEYPLTATEELRALEDEKKLILKESEALDAKYRDLSVHAAELEYSLDYVRSRISILMLKSSVFTTEYTAALEGFLCESDVDKLKKLIEKYPCYYELNDPGENENVPVHLENGKLATPFEAIIGLYSYPDYKGYDPTAIMGIFYFIIFGLMFADALYGALVTIGCILMLRIMKPKGSFRKIVASFAISGISSFIFGVIFGAYNGDMISVISQNMLGKGPVSLYIWFDPMSDPITLLIISLAVGALHLITGLIIKLYMECKRGHVLDAVCDEGSWLLIFLGMGVYFGADALGIAVVPMIGIGLIAAGVLLIVFMNAREEKNFILRIGKGLIGLYGIVNYASDLLSYSRILALGLSSAVIASVVNIMATLGGPSVPGVLLMIVVIPLGHALNIALNILGTFVHASRLQYIEFFGKFYEDGGKEFAPSSIETKYIDIIN